MAENDNVIYHKKMVALTERLGTRAYHRGGEPPSGSGMEQRIQRLEHSMDQIKDTLADIKAELAGIRAELKHLPTRGFVISTVIAIVGLVIAAIAVAPYLRVPA